MMSTLGCLAVIRKWRCGWPSGKRRLKGMIKESCVLEFMIGSWMNYLAGSSWVREKVVSLIYNFG